MFKSERRQEREVLELQCRLLRLKIAAEQQKLQCCRNIPRYASLLRTADRIGYIATHPRLLKFVLLPAKWTHRLLLATLLTVCSYWVDRDKLD